MWFAPEGVEPVYGYSFGRQNWFPYAAEEHRAAREAVALFDLFVPRSRSRGRTRSTS